MKNTLKRAVDLGVSLDVMGTSRGDGFGKFTRLEGLFGGGAGGKRKVQEPEIFAEYSGQSLLPLSF